MSDASQISSLSSLISHLTPNNTKKVADAYYVLSDATRRREYDDLLRSRMPSSSGNAPSAGSSAGGFPGSYAEDFDEFDTASQEQASGNFFNNFGDFFKKAGGSTGEQSAEGMGERPDANNVFGDVFEEM